MDDDVLKYSDFYIFTCPHCSQDIIVSKRELNCKIFRHGVYKSNYTQIPPHSTFEECQRLIANDLIYGCGKPFEVIEKNGKMVAISCDYK